MFTPTHLLQPRSLRQAAYNAGAYASNSITSDYPYPLPILLRSEAAEALEMADSELSNSEGSPIKSLKVTGCEIKEIKRKSKQALRRVISSSSSLRVQRLISRRHDLTKLLTIEVGEGANMKTFYVHTHLICAHAAFFQTACNGTWREGRESLIRLPMDDPETVGWYLQWLYTFELPKPKLKRRGVWESLVDLYVLGERFQDQTLKNSIVNAFIVGRRYASGCRWLTYAHNRLSEEADEGTPLRRLVVDLFVYWNVTQSNFEMEKDNLSKEACFEITMAMLKAREESVREAPYLADRCIYHEHEALAIETIDISVRYQIILPITWLTGETD